MNTHKPIRVNINQWIEDNLQVIDEGWFNGVPVKVFHAPSGGFVIIGFEINITVKTFREVLDLLEE